MNNTIKPKRRKYKDNPYTLMYEGKYQIKIKNSNQEIIVDVSKEVYEEFNNFELEDKREMNEYERKLTKFDLTDNDLYIHSKNKADSTEEIIEKNELNEEIKNAINKLSLIQKERIIKYYFFNMTLEEIARVENTSFQAVSKSINLALEKLKIELKNKI